MAVPGQYLAAVKAASAKYGVPADLLGAQIGAESGWNPNAKSPAGAEGISQFMPGTAKGYGIDPMNPMQSIDAQGKMMSSLLKSYKGNVPLALAAYNAGSGAVAKAGGKVPNIPETQNYIKTILSTRSRYPGLAAASSGLSLPSGVSAKTQMPVGASGEAAQTLSAPTQGAGMGTSIQELMGLAQQHLSNDPNAAPQPSILDTLLQPQQPTLTLPSGAPAKTQVNPVTALPSSTKLGSPGGNNVAPVIGEKNAKLIGLPYQGTHKLYGNWESDNAIDIAAPAHTPVYATADGTISSQIGSLNSSDPHMAGLRVHVDAGKQHFYYQHLASLTVKAGQQVKKGQLIGYTGALNHLHFAVESGDPRDYYK